jgi:hypothetical protein
VVFLAENVREKNVEHRREKEFMKSLVEDLKLDTAQFSSIMIFRHARLRNMDSLIVFFQVTVKERANRLITVINKEYQLE